ncbi:MAG: MmcQ/YjbR family DNA-binding protein [Cytophagaceae bacterium]|nr:MmcQ/YjbR family DNA-binding protein [Cytophagaceae bacterium]
MTVEGLRKISLELPEVTEDIKWEDHLCFSVGDKMFLVTSPDSFPVTASFKVPEDIFEEIISIEGFAKHKYIGMYHWIQLDDINRLNNKEWEQYIKESYHLVAEKLPKKTRKDLGLI